MRLKIERSSWQVGLLLSPLDYQWKKNQQKPHERILVHIIENLILLTLFLINIEAKCSHHELIFNRKTNTTRVKQLSALSTSTTIKGDTKLLFQAVSIIFLLVRLKNILQSVMYCKYSFVVLKNIYSSHFFVFSAWLLLLPGLSSKFVITQCGKLNFFRYFKVEFYLYAP